MKSSELGGVPLVVCALCETVLEPRNAERKVLDTPSGRAMVWVCKNCIRLGRAEQVRKYVMKQEKTRLGR
jgi:RNase P subunit RPR2